jgi:serine/threonine protein phosphatase PrpC
MIVIANLGDSKLFGVSNEGEVLPLTEVHNLGNRE